MKSVFDSTLGGRSEAAASSDVVLREWAEYLVNERSLNATTVRVYLRWAELFAQFRNCGGAQAWSATTAKDVTSFLMAQIPNLQPAARQRTVTAVRSLLRFLHISGRLGTRLDSVVPLLAHHRARSLPKWIAADEVAATIAALDPNTMSGRRDRAIVVIIARLGLRACEVARLSLDDIHWNQGTLTVHGKGGYLEVVPLPADVGSALAHYLSDPRPAGTAHRAVFLTSRAPLRPLSAAAIGLAVTAAGRRAGLNGIGAHRLRHTVATATLNAGASLEETGQLLRHHSLQSTSIYAKVDQTTLATIARHWPDDSVAAAEIGSRP